MTRLKVHVYYKAIQVDKAIQVLDLEHILVRIHETMGITAVLLTS